MPKRLMEIKLRQYQESAYDNIRNSYAAGARRVLFVLPTGGGKTYTFTYAAKMALEKGKVVFFLVHKKGLITQISDSLTDFGIRHGIIGGGKRKQYYLNAQVCSVQSLINRLADPTLPCPDLIIIDEAHHSTAGTWKKIVEHYSNTYILGVTATPIRTDGRGLGEIFETMVLGPEIMELIESKDLVMPIIYCPKSSIELDFSDVSKKSDGDYNEVQLVAKIDKPTITGDAIEKYRELCDKQPAIYFCINIAHSEHVAEQFRDAGYIAYAVHSNMEDMEIARILKGLGNGTIHVVTSCNLISEGTDVPKVSCIGHLRPTMSLGLYMQINGRGLRPALGKENCIIIDHVDNYKRHGHPCNSQAWTLDGIKRKNKSKEVAVVLDSYEMCDGCFAVFVAAPACPQCGKEVKKKAREIEIVEGELVAVQFDAIVAAVPKSLEISQSKTLSQLWDLKTKNGYKDRWVLFTLESRVLKYLRLSSPTLLSLNKSFDINAVSLLEQDVKNAVLIKFNGFMSAKRAKL